MLFRSVEAIAQREVKLCKQKVNIKVIYQIKGEEKETLQTQLAFNIYFSLKQICLL